MLVKQKQGYFASIFCRVFVFYCNLGRSGGSCFVCGWNSLQFWRTGIKKRPGAAY